MKSTKTFSIFSLNWEDYLDQIDPRLLHYTDGWKLIEFYKGQTVEIPPTWNSGFFPDRYFQVIKRPNDPNADESENEISLRIEGGWKGYDSEVIINLFIIGKNVKSDKNHVSAEILKAGGADMVLKFRGRTVTDFVKQEYWWKKHKIDKVWIDDMKEFL